MWFDIKAHKKVELFCISLSWYISVLSFLSAPWTWPNFCRVQRAYSQWDQKLCKFALNVSNILVYTIFSPKTRPSSPSYFLFKLSITYVNNQMRLHTKVDLMPDAWACIGALKTIRSQLHKKCLMWRVYDY